MDYGHCGTSFEACGNDWWVLISLGTRLNTNFGIEITKEDMAKLGLFTSIVGHVGDGNFHEAIMYHKTDPVETAAVQKHVNDMIDIALAMEGTCTVRKPYSIYALALSYNTNK